MSELVAGCQAVLPRLASHRRAFGALAEASGYGPGGRTRITGPTEPGIGLPRFVVGITVVWAVGWLGIAVHGKGLDVLILRGNRVLTGLARVLRNCRKAST